MAMMNGRRGRATREVVGGKGGTVFSVMACAVIAVEFIERINGGPLFPDDPSLHAQLVMGVSAGLAWAIGVAHTLLGRLGAPLTADALQAALADGKLTQNELRTIAGAALQDFGTTAADLQTGNFAPGESYDA